MNEELREHLTLKLSGTLEISANDLAAVLSRLPTRLDRVPIVHFGKEPENGGKMPRLAFSIAETAELLGVSGATVRRLIVRGLLKSSSALRTKLISKVEIERFLKETLKSVY